MAAAWDKSTSKEDLPYNVYAASKTEGERALWKFVKENNPPFAVNTVLPAANYGTILAPEISGSTMGWVRQLLSGNANVFTFTPPRKSKAFLVLLLIGDVTLTRRQNGSSMSRTARGFMWPAC